MAKQHKDRLLNQNQLMVIEFRRSSSGPWTVSRTPLNPFKPGYEAFARLELKRLANERPDVQYLKYRIRVYQRVGK